MFRPSGGFGRDGRNLELLYKTTLTMVAVRNTGVRRYALALLPWSTAVVKVKLSLSLLEKHRWQHAPFYTFRKREEHSSALWAIHPLVEINQDEGSCGRYSNAPNMGNVCHS